MNSALGCGNAEFIRQTRGFRPPIHRGRLYHDQLRYVEPEHPHDLIAMEGPAY